MKGRLLNMSDVRVLKNYINGEWVESKTSNFQEVYNPATGEVIAKVPLSTKEELDQAASIASKAFESWKKVSIVRRARMMFELQNKLIEHRDELAEIVTLENGKNLKDAAGEVTRGIESVESAAGITHIMMGETIANAATDVEVSSYKYPIGVIAGITPFNFPMMVPFWMFPMAIAAGNTFILKPSEQTPLLTEKVAEFMDEIGFPAGVFNVVHGAHDVVNAIIENKDIEGISFVGSGPVGRMIYERGCANMKRVQALTGANNHLIVLDDADLDDSLPKIIGGAFGSAGQRCMAAAVLLVQEGIYDEFMERFVKEAKDLVIGDGMDDTTYLGPVIREKNQQRTLNYIDQGVEEGARLTLDGREGVQEDGFFVGPTIFEDVTTDMTIWKEEVFAPFVSVIKVKDIAEAVSVANTSEFANGACLFTDSARAIRYFRENIDAGMLGINLGVPAPIAWFAFSGWKNSFYGDLHTNGKDGINFYTRQRTVTAQYLTNEF